MNESWKDILTAVQQGELNVDAALNALQSQTYLDLGHTKFDLARIRRNGLPEVVYAAGKTSEQVGEIFCRMQGRGNLMATRVSPEMAGHVLSVCLKAEYFALGRVLVLKEQEIEYKAGEIAIVTAGTSDLPVAEEARLTCEMFGVHARVYSDVGVAGIHRLFGQLDGILQARVVIVVAGMEGALASVVGGLVSQPVVAVPTSVGYGASFSGIAALLAMLNSCASGVTVVNIDNGYGAACAACRINNLCVS